jgi:hypothetical protein
MSDETQIWYYEGENKTGVRYLITVKKKPEDVKLIDFKEKYEVDTNHKYTFFFEDTDNNGIFRRKIDDNEILPSANGFIVCFVRKESVTSNGKRYFTHLFD